MSLIKENIERKAKMTIKEMTRVLNHVGCREATDAISKSTCIEDMDFSAPTPYWYGAKALEVVSRFEEIAITELKNNNERMNTYEIVKGYIGIIEDALIKAMDFPDAEKEARAVLDQIEEKKRHG